MCLSMVLVCQDKVIIIQHIYYLVPCPAHVAAITTGSSTVFVNGKGCGRVGDAITACTSVAAGSKDVFAG